MALMYVPQALPSTSGGKAGRFTDNLVPADEAKAAAKALHLQLVPAEAAKDGKKQQVLTSVAINSQGLVDSLEAAVSGLKQGQKYVLAVAASRAGSGGAMEPIASFMGGKDGAASVAVIGPFRDMLAGAVPGGASSSKLQLGQARFLVVAPVLSSGEKNQLRLGSAVQVQQGAPDV